MKKIEMKEKEMKKQDRKNTPFIRLCGLALLGSLLLTSLWACGTTPTQPDVEKVRKDADRGMQDLRREEERQRQNQ